jgi:hypothetical protein
MSSFNRHLLSLSGIKKKPATTLVTQVEGEIIGDLNDTNWDSIEATCFTGLSVVDRDHSIGHLRREFRLEKTLEGRKLLLLAEMQRRQNEGGEPTNANNELTENEGGDSSGFVEAVEDEGPSVSEVGIPTTANIRPRPDPPTDGQTVVESIATPAAVDAMEAEGFHVPNAKRAKIQESAVVARTGYFQEFSSALGPDIGATSIEDQIKVHRYMKQAEADHKEAEERRQVAIPVAEAQRQEVIRVAEAQRQVAEDLRKEVIRVAEALRKEAIVVAEDRHQIALSRLENERNESNARAEASRYSIPADQIEAGARARLMQDNPQLAASFFQHKQARVAYPKRPNSLISVLKMPYVMQRATGTVVIGQLRVLRPDLTADQLAELNSRLVDLCDAKPPALLPYAIKPDGRQHPTYGKLLYATTLPESIANSILDWALSTPLQDASAFAIGVQQPPVVAPTDINWQVRQKDGNMMALVVNLHVPAQHLTATNDRLVVLFAQANNVTILGEPPVVYVTNKHFKDDFPLGVQHALVRADPMQAMADLDPFRPIDVAHRQMAIKLRLIPILACVVTQSEWVRALDLCNLSVKFLTMDARPGHWGDIGNEYVPLSEWIKYVFKGANKVSKYPGRLANHVIAACGLVIEERRTETAKSYRVSDFKNICKVFSICQTIHNLPEPLCQKVKNRLSYAT